MDRLRCRFSDVAIAAPPHLGTGRAGVRGLPGVRGRGGREGRAVFGAGDRRAYGNRPLLVRLFPSTCGPLKLRRRRWPRAAGTARPTRGDTSPSAHKLLMRAAGRGTRPAAPWRARPVQTHQGAILHEQQIGRDLRDVARGEADDEIASSRHRRDIIPGDRMAITHLISTQPTTTHRPSKAIDRTIASKWGPPDTPLRDCHILHRSQTISTATSIPLGASSLTCSRKARGSSP